MIRGPANGLQAAAMGGTGVEGMQGAPRFAPCQAPSLSKPHEEARGRGEEESRLLRSERRRVSEGAGGEEKEEPRGSSRELEARPRGDGRQQLLLQRGAPPACEEWGEEGGREVTSKFTSCRVRSTAALADECQVRVPARCSPSPTGTMHNMCPERLSATLVGLGS